MLPCLPPSSLELWRRERASRQLSFWWKPLILIGHYGTQSKNCRWLANILYVPFFQMEGPVNTVSMFLQAGSEGPAKGPGINFGTYQVYILTQCGHTCPNGLFLFSAGLFYKKLDGLKTSPICKFQCCDKISLPAIFSDHRIGQLCLESNLGTTFPFLKS